jgi:nucleotide-binding universal stress UspA family protein
MRSELVMRGELPTAFVAAPSGPQRAQGCAEGLIPKETIVVKLLLAVDGSGSAVRATRNLIETAAQWTEPPEVELLTVHHAVPPVDGFSGTAGSGDRIDRDYRKEGEKALAPSRELLEAAGVKFTAHVLVGEIASTIVEHARNAGCQMIYMGTRGMTTISNLVLGSVATKVLHLARVPVALVR